MAKTQHLGKNIKLARIARGLTQLELAERIHKTRSLISHIEQTGKVHQSTYTLILDVLEMGEDQLKKIDRSIGEPLNESTLEELKQVRKELEQLRHENGMLQDLVENQRKLIHYLEQKK